MRSPAFSAAALLCLGTVLTGTCRADDVITPETLAAVKDATVFIRVELGNHLFTGSGVVAAVDRGTVHIVTNHHVIAPTLPEGPGAGGGGALLHLPQAPLVTFRSSLRGEKSYRGQVVAADARRDLAVVRLTGVTSPPVPVEVEHSRHMMETSTVYIFGFPYGHHLATNRGNPGVTVNKGAISALRNDSAGELSLVQINGDMNPGNSGGPIVDADGRLVGVAFAVMKDPKTEQYIRIGMAVPPVAVARMLKKLRVPAPSIEPPAVVVVSTVPVTVSRSESRGLTAEELNAAVTDLRSPNEYHRCKAALLLAQSKPSEVARAGVAAALEPLMSDRDTFTRKVGAQAIGVWGGPGHVDRLVELVGDKEYKVRWAALLSLGRLGDRRGLAAVAARLDHEGDRQKAVEALQEFGAAAEAAVVPSLRAAAAATRAAACDVLKAVGTSATLRRAGGRRPRRR